MKPSRITRRSMAARLSSRAAGLGALALAVGMPVLALAAGGPLNPALVAKDLAASALPSGFATELTARAGAS